MPYPRLRPGLGQALGVSAEDLELLFEPALDRMTPDHGTPDAAESTTTSQAGSCYDLSETWEAEQAADLIAALDAAGEAETAELAGRITRQWLVTPPPHRVELAAGRRIGTALIDTLEHRIVTLRHLDDFVGGRDLQVLVERELALTGQLVSHATQGLGV
jgi:hypothetical protein